MDRVLTIANGAAVRLAEQRAHLVGTAVEGARRAALVKLIAQGQQRDEDDALTARLPELGGECAAWLLCKGGDFPLTDIEPALKD